MSTQKNKFSVSDVMIPFDSAPIVRSDTILKVAMEEMGRSRLGIICIVDGGHKLIGILTDGDIRRNLLRMQKPFSAFFLDDAFDHSIKSPITIKPNDSLINAITLMGDKQIWDLPVVDADGRLTGLLHLHRAIQALLEI